jgi:hypothetical protein
LTHFQWNVHARRKKQVNMMSQEKWFRTVRMYRTSEVSWVKGFQTSPKEELPQLVQGLWTSKEIWNHSQGYLYP